VRVKVRYHPNPVSVPEYVPSHPTPSSVWLDVANQRACESTSPSHPIPLDVCVRAVCNRHWMLLVSTLLRGRVLSSFFSASVCLSSLCLLAGFWGVGGWGDVNVHCDCNHAVRSLALPHMLRCCTFSCTSTHTTCYAAALHFHTYVMLHCCTFSCTSTHTSCYAAALHFHTYVMLRCCAALPHIRHATLLHCTLNNHNLCQAKFRVQWLS